MKKSRPPVLFRHSYRAWTLATMACGCGGAGADLADGQPRDSAGIAVVETRSEIATVWHSDTTPLLEIGGVRGANVDLFRVAAIARLEDGRVIIADGTPRLLAFSAQGELLQTASRRGAGPGEFEAIGWMHRLPGDSLIVHDPRLMRASVFTDSLTFVRTLAPERPASGTGGVPELVGMFRDRTLLASSRRMATAPPDVGRMVRPDQVLYRHDADGAVRDSLTTVAGDEAGVTQGIIVRPPFAKRTRIAVGQDEFFVATGDRFEVAAYGADGRLRSIFRRPTPNLPVTETDLARFRFSDQLGLGGSLTFPAISAMLVDDVGHIWVEAFRKDPADVSTWTVFDPNGRAVARWTPPHGFRPLVIASDFVLGVWQDELGVERVRSYRLSREAAQPSDRPES